MLGIKLIACYMPESPGYILLSKDRADLLFHVCSVLPKYSQGLLPSKVKLSCGGDLWECPTVVRDWLSFEVDLLASAVVTQK